MGDKDESVKKRQRCCFYDVCDRDASVKKDRAVLCHVRQSNALSRMTWWNCVIVGIVCCEDKDMEKDLCPMVIEVILVSEQHDLYYKQYDCRHLGRC